MAQRAVYIIKGNQNTVNEFLRFMQFYLLKVSENVI